MTLSTSFDTVESVLHLASLVEDRTDKEQRALLSLAFSADCHHNKATTTNRGFGIGEPSDLVGLVDGTREPTSTRIWLTDRQEATRERQLRAWKEAR